jgi:methyl coenzyme M reductase beta subunit
MRTCATHAVPERVALTTRHYLSTSSQTELIAMPSRVIIRLEITPQAKTRLAEVTDAMGMTQVALTSRLVEWFAAQPEVIRAAVMGHYPKEIEADVAKLILKRMASSASASEK